MAVEKPLYQPEEWKTEPQSLNYPSTASVCACVMHTRNDIVREGHIKFDVSNLNAEFQRNIRCVSMCAMSVRCH